MADLIINISDAKVHLATCALLGPRRDGSNTGASAAGKSACRLCSIRQYRRLIFPYETRLYANRGQKEAGQHEIATAEETAAAKEAAAATGDELRAESAFKQNFGSRPRKEPWSTVPKQRRFWKRCRNSAARTCP